MTVRPIPSALLCDELTLLVPDGSGYDSTEVYAVRVLSKSQVSEYSSTIKRDNSEITVYYDCRESFPQDLEFTAGMLIEYDTKRYEIITAETFCTDSPHHIRITAKRV